MWKFFENLFGCGCRKQNDEIRIRIEVPEGCSCHYEYNNCDCCGQQRPKKDWIFTDY